jgi:hypothetical protein
MSHEELIIRLASEARAVQPLPPPAVRLARWMALALAVVAIAVAWRGVRANWAAAFADPTFVITNVLVLAVGVLAGWVALRSAVPGAVRSPVETWVPVAALGAWGAILIQQVAAAGPLVSAIVSEGAVAGCMWKTYGIAVGPALVILLLARRAAPLDWRWTGGLSALSALAFGVIGTELICPITGHAHLFNWHYLPVAVMTVIGFGAGSLAARANWRT